MTFAHLDLHASIYKAITESGYKEPTPIQEKAIPVLLDGHDLLGSASTGTGKTAAFALPMIHQIQKAPQKGRHRDVQGLVLAPTRELALQIKESFDTYSRKNHVKTLAVYGGMSKRGQIMKIKRGVDILIATPGRLLDLMNMNIVKLNRVKYYVLDEVDQMLDMGFIDDVKKISSSVPKERQTMLFSATIPKTIESLAKQLLNNPVRLEMAAQNAPLETVEQKVYFIDHRNKVDLLMETLKSKHLTSALVFVRTKRGCDQVAKKMNALGLNVGALHGDKSQKERQQVLKAFKNHEINVLLATDVAARGIDIDALSHVINLDMPQTPETYMHRIGRTARAGKLGAALSFCANDERHLLKAVQKHIGFNLPVQQHDMMPKASQSKGKSQSNKNQSQSKRKPQGYAQFKKKIHQKPKRSRYKQSAKRYAT